MNEHGTDIIAWADEAMYESQPILKEEGARVTPRVFLISGTPDPLGVLAVDMRMYRGDPVYSINDITQEERKWAWDELSKTRLNTPLEGVQVKLMLEAVTRSFTHQLVRQRVGAYYVQESLRFAVKRGLASETALPPSIVDTNEGAGKIWQDTVQSVAAAYEALVNAGIPAEDARGLLPHCTTTRVLYNTNLRALFDHAGNRLCTQAQFEWRAVFMGIMEAMRDYGGLADGWQWSLIGTPTPMTFAPICYKTGKCEFMSQLDRGCSIRERVERYHLGGVPSSQWDDIDPVEWMGDPTAGVTTKDNRPT
jgi:flavin-dependent thymidylate synthase